MKKEAKVYNVSHKTSRKKTSPGHDPHKPRIDGALSFYYHPSSVKRIRSAPWPHSESECDFRNLSRTLVAGRRVSLSKVATTNDLLWPNSSEKLVIKGGHGTRGPKRHRPPVDEPHGSHSECLRLEDHRSRGSPYEIYLWCGRSLESNNGRNKRREEKFCQLVVLKKEATWRGRWSGLPLVTRFVCEHWCLVSDVDGQVLFLFVGTFLLLGNGSICEEIIQEARKFCGTTARGSAEGSFVG